MPAPHGPYRISPQRQVTLPADVMKAVGLSRGEDIYYEVGGYPPGCVLIVASRLVQQWYEAGRAVDEGPGAAE